MDYVICWWCGVEFSPTYTYEYLEDSSYYEACIRADTLCGEYAIKNNGDYIRKQAALDYRYDNLVDAIDAMILEDFTRYEVWRVNSKPENITTIDEDFCHNYCTREV